MLQNGHFNQVLLQSNHLMHVGKITYRIVENIHQLLEALCFPECGADLPIGGEDLQGFQR